MNTARRTMSPLRDGSTVFDMHGRIQVARAAIHDASPRLASDRTQALLDALDSADAAGDRAEAENAKAAEIAAFLTLALHCARAVSAFALEVDDLTVWAADHVLSPVPIRGASELPDIPSVPQDGASARGPRAPISAALREAYSAEDCHGHLLSIRSVINDAMQRTTTPLLQASADAIDRAISASDMATKHGASSTDITNFATLMLSANALLQDAASGIDVDESLWCGAALMVHVAASARALIEGDTIAAGVAEPVGQAPRTDEATKAIVVEAWSRTGEAIGVFDAAFFAFKSEPIRPVMEKARKACNILSGELDPDPDCFPRMEQCRTALQILTWAHTELDRLIADGSDGEEGDSPAGTAARTGGLTLLGLAISGLEQAVGTPPKAEQPARNDAPAFRAPAPAKAQPAKGREAMPRTLEGVLYECERNTQHALASLKEAAERLDDDDLRIGVEGVQSAHAAACKATSDEGTAADFERLETLLKAADTTLLLVAEGLGDDAVWCAVSLLSMTYERLRDTVLAGAGLDMKRVEAAHA